MINVEISESTKTALKAVHHPVAGVMVARRPDRCDGANDVIIEIMSLCLVHGPRLFAG